MTESSHLRGLSTSAEAMTCLCSYRRLAMQRLVPQ
jgi:hypothetical protein